MKKVFTVWYRSELTHSAHLWGIYETEEKAQKMEGLVYRSFVLGGLLYCVPYFGWRNSIDGLFSYKRRGS